MKIYKTSEIRNLALLGNAGSGKTTLSEALLFEGGVISRRGDISSKNTVSDNHEIEHERGSSVYANPLYAEYNDHKINFIDTPGADDFSGATISALSAVDCSLLLINAQNGVEVGTETLMRHTDRYEKPVILVANQMDHEKSNFDKVVESAKESFGNKAIVAQYPMNEGESFDTIVDVIKKVAIKFPKDGGKPEELPIPGSEADKAENYYSELVEIAAEADEELMEVFFENDTLNEEQLTRGLKKGLAERGLFPILCTSAINVQGTKRLMEFVIDNAPSPTDAPDYKTEAGTDVKCDSNGKPIVYIFKTYTEQHLGEICYFRVMSGKISEGMDLINANNRSKERFSQIFAAAGKNREKQGSMNAGDIGATVKLKDTKTFNTLGDKDMDSPIKPVELPNPKYRTAVKTIDESDDEKLGETLTRLHQEDPSLLIEYSKELKQIILSGQGEYHLTTTKWLLENIFKVPVQYISPKIPYRETITKISAASFRHKKQSGGAGQFGEVHLIVEPHDDSAPERKRFKVEGKELVLSIRGTEEHKLTWGGKLIFNNCIVGGSIDTRFLPAILKGLMEKLENGPLTGSYARDIRVYVYDGKMHPVDSNEISFKLAGAKAFSEAFRNAGPKILEPIYVVEVMVPSDRMGDVMSDLQGRRAMILGMSSEGRYEILKAKVPLAEMDKYSTTLSSLTNGRANYTMKFDEYSLVPPDVQDKLQATYDAEQDEE